MASEQTLAGKDVLKVKDTNIVRPYTSEKEGYKGKQYRIYAFGKSAFTVHEDSKFHKELTAGNVESIQISVNDEGQWGMDSFLTWTQVNNYKLNQAKSDAITPEFVKASLKKELNLVAMEDAL